ncbi:unnamed protein product [Orchesella dallaii]|uniref:Uncharacterized protein n=1 Tax=Orchesella dallaii TaxID=48710 RepID=A0ABP1S7D0_9HEXA
MSNQRYSRKRTHAQPAQRDLKDVDYDLRKFGESLKAPEQYEEDARRLINKVVLQTLRKESKYSIGRHDFGGSYAKKTDVINPDLDTVARVRNCRPPFNKVLDDWERVLRANEKCLKIKPGIYKKSERSLNFFFTNGISVDLLPAVDANENDLVKISKEMGRNKKTAYYNGAVFVEDQVEFLKSKSYSGFTNTVVRLSKFCFKSWYLGGEKCPGGSAMIELIAVAAVEKEFTRNYASEFRALKEVMVMLSNLDTLKLAFSRVDDDDDDEPEWELVKQSKLQCRNENWLIPDIVGKREILERDCFIIDPANPFQDYLEEKSRKVFVKIKNFANNIIDRLDLLLREKEEEGCMQKLFKPMLKDLTKENQSLFLPTDFLLTCDKRYNPNSVYNEVKIWNDSIMEDEKISRAVKVLKKNLITVVHSTVEGNPDTVTVDDVQEAVEDLIENNLQTDIEDASRRDKHSDNYDVTIKVPYFIDDKSYAVFLSLLWDSD